jgi:hypothetical protein
MEQQAAAIRDRLRTSDHGDGASQDGDDASILSDAAAVARLHNQAAAVQNIRNLIPLVLDLKVSNYSNCRDHFILVLSRFSLREHVLDDAVHPDDAAWTRMDCVVVSWIFNTISSDLLDDIHQHDGLLARAAWLDIEQQFLNNRESRVMLLDAEFRALSQGALSIDEYCRKMKGIADSLADLGELVSDRTFVLNLLRGLNEQYKFMAQLVTR